MKNWKKELKELGEGGVTFDILSKRDDEQFATYEELEGFIEALLEEAREEVVKEIEWGLAKELYYEWTFSQIKEYLSKYLTSNKKDR